MKTAFLIIIFLVFDTTVNAGRSSGIEPIIIAQAATTYVVNLEFCSSCLSEEDKKEKDTLGEVHTYAELQNDPRADLPSSFTICSSVMTTYRRRQMLFNLLGNDGNKWLGSHLRVDDETYLFNGQWTDVRLPPVEG